MVSQNLRSGAKLKRSNSPVVIFASSGYLAPMYALSWAVFGVRSVHSSELYVRLGRLAGVPANMDGKSRCGVAFAHGRYREY